MKNQSKLGQDKNKTTGIILKLSQSEKKALKQLKEKITSMWPQTRFILFGSKAVGGADAESDIDLLITMPCEVTDMIREHIIHLVFEINLELSTNISALILSKKEWESPPYSLLPIYFFIQEEGVAI